VYGFSTYDRSVLKMLSKHDSHQPKKFVYWPTDLQGICAEFVLQSCLPPTEGIRALALDQIYINAFPNIIADPSKAILFADVTRKIITNSSPSTFKGGINNKIDNINYYFRGNPFDIHGSMHRSMTQ